MRKAVIDIGSNSIKMAIGEAEGGDLRVLEFLKSIVSLGKSTFYRGALSRETTAQTIDILRKYMDKLREYEVDEVKVIATTAIREAVNRDIFLDNIRRSTGLQVEVLDVGNIIYYMDSYLAHRLKNRFPVKEETLLLAEMGTGSLDVSGIEKGNILFNLGLPVGTLRLANLVGELSGSMAECQEAVADFIENEFSFLKKNITGVKIDDILLIDENYARYIPNIIRSQSSKENFFRFRMNDVNRMLEKLEGMGAEEIADRFRMPIEVADTITAYALVLKNFCGLLKKKHVHIFDISLSEAVLANILLEISPEKGEQPGHLVSEAVYLCRKYGQDLDHARHVAELSGSLFEAFRDYMGLREEDKVYLTLASYLHDVGMFIYNRAHHKHSEYILRFVNMSRLSNEERKIIACVARYHRKAAPGDNHPVYASLSYNDRIVVQKLSAILRMANALDSSHKQKVRKLEVRTEDYMNFTLVVYTKKNFLLEKADLMNSKKVFESTTGSNIRLVVKE